MSTAQPGKDKPELSNKTYTIIGGVAALALLFGLVSCLNGGDNTAQETAQTETAVQEEKQDAMPWLEKQMGSTPAEVLTRDPSLWYGYVSGAYFDHGNLHVQLQVDRKEDKALGEQAAHALSNLVGLSNDPEVADIDGHAVVEDGAGVVIDQKMINRN